MKYIILTIFIAMFYGFIPKESNIKNHNCLPSQFFILSKKEVQKDFFVKLDSVVAVQYRNQNDKRISDITPKMLNTFLKDIDRSKLISNYSFSKEYRYNLSLDTTLKLKDYRNTFTLTFYPEDCSFRLSIVNFFDTELWSEETSISYSFSILDDRIVDFNRQEAG